MNSVSFEFGRSRTTPETRATLRDNAAWIINHPGVSLQIEGYCDRHGPRAYNYQLGMWRAQTVKAYLEKQGVKPSVLKAVVSFGSAAFIDDGLSVKANKRNRRVNFRIVGVPENPPLAPVRLPAQTTTEPVVPPVNTKWGLGINPKVFYSRIDALDTGTMARATILSTLNYGLDVRLDDRLSQHWFASLHYDINSVHYSPPLGQSLLNSPSTTNGFALEIKNQVSEKFSYSVLAVYEQDLFITGQSLINLTVDKNYIPKASARFSYDVARFGVWKWGLEARGDSMFAASTRNYTVDPGLAFGGKLYLNREIPYFPVHIGVGYLRQFQRTTISAQVEQELSFEAGFTWKF